MMIGYIRVSTEKQNFDTQFNALQKEKVEKIFEEKKSGRTMERPELQKALDFMREGDTLVVYDLSRLGRNTKGVISFLEELKKNRINFISLKEGFDVTTPIGSALVTILSTLNQMDLEIRNEKTREGLALARARGRNGGRPKLNSKIIDHALLMYDSKNYSIKEILNATGISNGTLYSAIKKRI